MEAGLGLIRHEHIYQVIKEEHHYPITELCKFGNVSRVAYYNSYIEKLLKTSKRTNALRIKLKKSIQSHQTKDIAELGMNGNAIMALTLMINVCCVFVAN